MLQQMRSLAKYIWGFVALAFVGGFLLYETTGLIGRTAITPTTAVAVVNGTEIPYNVFMQRVQYAVQQAQDRDPGRPLSQDDNRQIEQNVFDQMVGDILLADEYRKRGITVTDDEVRQYAQIPPPELQNNPELMTDGRFDPEKYRRLMGSSQARQSGLLYQIEQYYRGEIPQAKLLEQIQSGVFVSDVELWRAWRDQHDSAQVSFVAFSPTPDSAFAKSIPESDLRAYFEKHKSEFEGTGRAVLTVVVIPKTVTAADTATARARAEALRAEIVKGAKFEDVAKRESSDSISAQQGGDLGKQPKGLYVPEFGNAAAALKVGEISQPVLSPFGFHLIRMDSRSGDTLGLHHILIPIRASDSVTSRIDKEADQLARMAANSEQGAKLDSAAAALRLQKFTVDAIEDQPASRAGRIIPSVSAWAFGGARVGETSDLYDDDAGYYLARLDSLRPGGEPKFENVQDEVRARVALERQLDKLTPQAQTLATAAGASTLESAAQQAGKKVEQTGMFARASMVPGLGQFSQPIGAAFALPVGAVSQPIRSDSAVYVLRVDKRVQADSTAWVNQKQAQRTLREQQLRSQKVQMFLQDMRKGAKIDDRRKQINEATRRAQS